MIDRLTDRARRVLALARREAQRLEHDRLAALHVLLGILEEGGGVAMLVLERMALDPAGIRREVERRAPAGRGLDPRDPLPLADGAEAVLEAARAEASGLGHDYVGTEHLLLGLLHRQEGVASAVLTDLGLELERVRAAVVDILLDESMRRSTLPPE